MQELLETMDGWRAEGAGIGRAVVVRTFGSAPRPEGAVLLRADDGRIAGSVSGGCVEGAAAEEIERARKDGNSRVIRYGISDEEAWDVGLACGGTIDVLVEPALDDATVAGAHARGRAVATIPPSGRAAAGVRAPRARRRVAARRPHRGRLGRVDGRVVGQHGGRRRASSRRRGRAAARDLPDGHRRRSPGLRGGVPGQATAGDRGRGRGRAVARGVREGVGYTVVVVDGRASFATPERFPADRVDRLVVGWPDEVADEIGLGRDDAVAVLTHDVKFDEPAIVEALRRGCRYVGAVGSKKTQGDRRERLREAGVTDAELARLRGPVGLDLGGRNPSETALAIMAEVVAERYGGSGAPLVDWARALEAAAVG